MTNGCCRGIQEVHRYPRALVGPGHPGIAINRIGLAVALQISPASSFFFRSPPRTPHLFSLPLIFHISIMPSPDIEAELEVLTLLTQDSPISKEQQQVKKIKRRDSELDPLILAAAFASGPHITRHHYSHDFFPAVGDPRAEGAWDWTKWTGEGPTSVKQDPKRRSYVSQQAPRRQRLKALGLPVDPEPQAETLTSPTEPEFSSPKTQTRSPRPSISNGAVPNERACYMCTIKSGASSQRPTANI